MADEAFRRRIKVFRLPDARISTAAERFRCGLYWEKQFRELDALVREHGAAPLGIEGFKEYTLMQNFALQVGDMLALIADTLTPRDIEELKRHAFDDPSPTPSSE